jgi:hypothetical protein
VRGLGDVIGLPLALALSMCLACYGLAWVVGQSHLTLPLRQYLSIAPRGPRRFLLTLMECVGCFGFWEGFALGLFLSRTLLLAVVLGFAVSASNLILDAAVSLGENHRG